MTILYYIFMTYGLTNILVFGKIFDKPRTWLSNKSKFLKGLLNCVMCVSVYIGILSSLFFYSPVLALKIDNLILNWHYGMFYPFALFLDAMFTSGVCWLIHNFEEAFERAFKQNQ